MPYTLSMPVIRVPSRSQSCCFKPGLCNLSQVSASKRPPANHFTYKTSPKEMQSGGLQPLDWFAASTLCLQKVAKPAFATACGRRVFRGWLPLLPIGGQNSAKAKRQWPNAVLGSSQEDTRSESRVAAGRGFGGHSHRVQKRQRSWVSSFIGEIWLT